MKKLLAILLAVTMLASVATVASAANTTTLTTTVPAATYTLNIPADQEIPFGAESTNIGAFTVSNASGFAEGKNLKVSFTYGDFVSDGVNTTIPFVIGGLYGNDSHEWRTFNSGDNVVFRGVSNGGVAKPYAGVNQTITLENLCVKINSTDWGKALAGEYTATITFTAEVVAE